MRRKLKKGEDNHLCKDPLLKQSMNSLEESNRQRKQEEEGSERMEKKSSGREDIADMADHVQCMTICKRKISKKELMRRKYAWWRQEQKTRAAKLEKQLKVKGQFEELIEEQLNWFHNHYIYTMIPIRMKDVSGLLIPERAAPHELAALSWFGDWRPTAILELLRVLASSSFSFSCLSDKKSIERRLSQLISEIRIEEAIIDEEMAEVQARCIFHLPFASVNNRHYGAEALSSIQYEFKKIGKIITRAQQLRFTTLEMVLRKVLNEINAAEFLVAFAGIQDVIHRFASKQKPGKGPVTNSIGPFLLYPSSIKSLGPAVHHNYEHVHFK